MRRKAFLLLALCALGIPAFAQRSPDVIYVPTPPDVIEAMLRLDRQRL